LIAVAETVSECPAGQLLRIVELPRSLVVEFFFCLFRRFAGIAAHHGNPHRQHVQICIGKGLQDSIPHRPGALVDSLGSSGRENGDEAALIGVLVECLDQWLKGFIQSDKH
jgi:hypothetical protein